MKKKYIKEIIATGLVCVMTLSPVAAFADVAEDVEKEASVNTPSGAVVNLSLEDVYKKLETSISMEMINIQKESDEAIAKGYSENYKDLKDLDKMMGIPGIQYDPRFSEVYWSYDSSNLEMVKTMRTFANSVLKPNHQARVNALQRDTFEDYFTLKNLESQVGIAKENVEINEKLLANTELMYKVGKASKLDLNNATSGLNTAKDSYRAALDGLNALKMAFNMTMDYPLMQNTKLTTEIEEGKMPQTTLEKAVENAIANRLEIKEAAYNLQMANLNFGSYSAYPRTSSKYLTAKVGVLGAQMANNMSAKQVEMDVRMKYAAMNTAFEKVQTSKKSVSDAEESVNIVKLQYEYGMTTLTTLQQANLGLTNAKIAQANALLEYNLAVKDFELAQGVGVTAAKIAGAN